jgi:hypothetical protein
MFWRSISQDNVTTWYGRTADSLCLLKSPFLSMANSKIRKHFVRMPRFR